MPIREAAEVVEDRDDTARCSSAVLLAAQPPADHLHVAHGAEDLACNQDHVGPGCVETCGQYAVIAEHANFPVLEAIKDLFPHDGPRVIYGETTRLGAARLAAENIVFKQIPYDVKMR